VSYELELTIAVEAAREAANLCQDVRREMAEGALTKDDRSPVTVADFGSQALVCRRLKEAFPDDAIVAEEDASALRSDENAGALAQVVDFVNRYQSGGAEAIQNWIDMGNGEAGNRYWTVDPIDGTKGFLRQDQYAVAIALVEEGDVQVGVLASPALPMSGQAEPGSLFTATRGSGAFQASLGGGTQAPIRVAGEDSNEAQRFVESVEAAHGNHALQQAIASAAGIEEPPLRMDSQAKYGAVARGDAILYLRLPSPKYADYREKVWDHAAGVLVVEEAGGRVTDVFGRRLDFGVGSRLEKNLGVVVSNGEIHDAVLEPLRKAFSNGEMS